MNEFFLHYIWKLQLFTTSDLKTVAGENIVIIQKGEHNTNAGPDFLNARIRIGDTVWAGNVEIHIRSSDWNIHHHQHDRVYDTVILHVVYEHDDMNSELPTLVLKNIIPPDIFKQYNLMMQTGSWIPCEKNIHTVPEIVVKNQLSRILAERFAEKALKYEQRLLLNKNDWEETTYQLLARSFGTNVNADPFEHLAQSLPFHIIRRHLNKPEQVEAMLFGQAGFLQGSFREMYPHQLQSEYQYLQKKYSFEPIRKLEWKFLRLRPANFPTIRLSQFANFIATHDKLFHEIISLKSYEQLQSYFQTTASPYWREHYSFKKASAVKEPALGKDTLDLILINTVSPLIYLYGQKTGSQQYIAQAVDLLEHIPPEKNAVMAKWDSLQIKPTSAAESQSLLYLKKEYCVKKRCLDCGIGNAVLQNKKN
ncbi:MAG: DUF2851 family protein [Chitinophagales bacterium]|nr:DUF2851 family protein [Chitinophagales bacterium]